MNLGSTCAKWKQVGKSSILLYWAVSHVFYKTQYKLPWTWNSSFLRISTVSHESSQAVGKHLGQVRLDSWQCTHRHTLGIGFLFTRVQVSRRPAVRPQLPLNLFCPLSLTHRCWLKLKGQEGHAAETVTVKCRTRFKERARGCEHTAQRSQWKRQCREKTKNKNPNKI